VHPSLCRLHESAAVEPRELKSPDWHGAALPIGRAYLNVPGRDGFLSTHAVGGPMVAWIGVDDTDSLQGMCTTFLAAEIVRELTTDFDLVGYPRLVRLNQNVQWKKRGNGAICVRFGQGDGRRNLIERHDDRHIWSQS